MTTVTTRTVEYPADGLTMIGHLALPSGVDRRPAVLIGPEGLGLSDVERRRADALAELGYVGSSPSKPKTHIGMILIWPTRSGAKVLEPADERGLNATVLVARPALRRGPAGRGQALAARRPNRYRDRRRAGGRLPSRGRDRQEMARPGGFDVSITIMTWWRRKPSRPVDSDPELVGIRRDLVWKFGEEIAYAIRLTGKDQTPVGRATWAPLSPDEALEHIEGLLGERVSLSTPIRVEVQAAASGRWVVCMMDQRR